MKRRSIVVLFVLLSTFSVLFADVDLTVGTIRLVIKDYDGTVSLYRELETGDFVPLLESNRYTTKSAFYALVDQDVYKLATALGINIYSSFEGNTATSVFTIQDEVNVSIRYTIFSSVAGNPEDSIKVTIEYINVDEVPHLIGIKSVFDTWLGENSGTHFTTVLRDKLDSEYYFTDMRQDYWIQSSNKDASVRFLLSGDQVTVAQTIAVANVDVLSTSVWAPTFSVGKRFDSLQSYNNSALSVTWQPVIMDAGSSRKIQFYISTATGEDYPVDIRFMRHDPEAVAISSDSMTDTELEHFVETYPEIPDSEIVTLENQEDIIAINNILARIRELEVNPDAVKREEILRLNFEIDKILDKIGR